MPSSLYSIEQYAFYDCPKLRGVELPDGLAIIEQRAFCGCDSVTEIAIPASCTAVGEYAFLNCNSLNEITVEGNGTSFGQRSLGYEYDNGYSIKEGFIIDASSGTAADYAEENGIRLKSGIIMGDVNTDGLFNAADLVMMQRFILGKSCLNDYAAGDLCRNGEIDVFDIIEMRRKLLKGMN